MADDIAITPGTGATVATDEVGGKHYQLVKTAHGALDAAVITQDTPTGRFPVGGGAIGAVDETAPASDTAASGLNGRMQRIAQRITSLIGLLPASLGRKAAASSLAAVLSTEDKASLDAVGTKLDSLMGFVNGTEYETVAASQTDQALGATGAAGDFLAGLLVVPATTSPGPVSIKDGAGNAITVFTGGTSSVATLHPFPIPLGLISGGGAWQITTGANVSVIAGGNFT